MPSCRFCLAIEHTYETSLCCQQGHIIELHGPFRYVSFLERFHMANQNCQDLPTFGGYKHFSQAQILRERPCPPNVSPDRAPGHRQRRWRGSHPTRHPRNLLCPRCRRPGSLRKTMKTGKADIELTIYTSHVFICVNRRYI